MFVCIKRYITQTYREGKVRLPSYFTSTVNEVTFYGRLNIDTIRIGEHEKTYSRIISDYNWIHPHPSWKWLAHSITRILLLH